MTDNLATLESLMTNPTGPNTRHVGARYAIRNALEAVFINNMKDPKKSKLFKIRKVTKADNVYKLWLVIPSSSYDDLSYDVFIDLTFDEGTVNAMKSFVKLYTNAPSWIFTLGYVLKSRDMVPDEWTHAMGDAATEPPTVTNLIS